MLDVEPPTGIKSFFASFFSKKEESLLFLILCSTAQAQTVTLPAPSLAGSLGFPAQPYSVDTGPLGTVYIDGVLSGLGLVQSSPSPGDRRVFADIGNGQLIVQKIDGFVQFYAQAGLYSLADLAAPYANRENSPSALGNFFGVIPQVYLKLVPSDSFSVQAGKLQSLVGPENNFTFENFNIERGLFWGQGLDISRGVQANYTRGPLAFSLSLNDGYYSDRYTWLTGALTWTIDPVSTIVFGAGANFGASRLNRFAAPLAQDNGAIYNLAYTYTANGLTVTPYVQYNHVQSNDSIGLYNTANSYGAAVLANDVIAPHFQIAGRAEYILTDSTKSARPSTNLLDGPGSGGYSFTLTPTFTYHRYFVRAEASLCIITNLTPGDGFGADGDRHRQYRGLLETGILF